MISTMLILPNEPKNWSDCCSLLQVPEDTKAAQKQVLALKQTFADLVLIHQSRHALRIRTASHR
ncbi:hypothetical protein ACEQPO_07095 [Bacillus sp. SL00103]